MIWWVGSAQDLTSRMLSAGSQFEVVNLDDSRLVRGSQVTDQVAELQALIENRPVHCLGIALPPGLAGLRAAAGADGLARAVGWADCLAFAGGLPGGFAFLARVGGMVRAIREAVGEQYLPHTAQLDTRGPAAWAAMAALTELRVTGISAIPDAMTGAVAHRLGIELVRGGDSETFGNSVSHPKQALIRHDASGFSFVLDEGSTDASTGRSRPVKVDNELIELHTVAAQIRLFTSREPDLERMRRELTHTAN